MSMFTKFGKNLLLPAAALVVVFIAAGSAATVATTNTFTRTGMRGAAADGPKPASPVRESNPALENFCDQFWGDLSSDGLYCRFSQSFHLNLAHAGRGTVLTNIPVVPSDTLSVDSANLPDVVIGSEAYDAGVDSFVAESAGYLSFRTAPGQDIFSVQRVSMERCYAAPEGRVVTVVCP